MIFAFFVFTVDPEVVQPFFDQHFLRKLTAQIIASTTVHPIFAVDVVVFAEAAEHIHVDVFALVVRNPRIGFSYQFVQLRNITFVQPAKHLVVRGAIIAFVLSPLLRR
jgi:hypothetical protein